jgi:N-acetyl-alpha-D-muramate 1-phosphate uridylyltransferase
MLPVAILAGGMATRLGDLTKLIPKSLVQVAGKPFVVHQLRLLQSNGIQHVILCVGHLGEMIEKVIGNGHAFGLNVEYSYDGEKLQGTAGAIRNALPMLGQNFFVMYGDSYLPCDFAAVERAFERQGKSALMTVFRNNGQWDVSNVEFDGKSILAYSKKNRTARMNYIDYGLGVFSAKAFAQTRIDNADLADVYGELLRHGQLAGYEVHKRFYEIGSRSGLQETADFLVQRGTARR